MEISVNEKTSDLDEQASVITDEDKALQKVLDISKRDQSMKENEREELENK